MSFQCRLVTLPDQRPYGPTGPTKRPVPTRKPNFLFGNLIFQFPDASRQVSCQSDPVWPRCPTEGLTEPPGPPSGPSRPKTKLSFWEPHISVSRCLTPSFVSIRPRLVTLPDQRPYGPTGPTKRPVPARKPKMFFGSLIFQCPDASRQVSCQSDLVWSGFQKL